MRTSACLLTVLTLAAAPAAAQRRADPVRELTDGALSGRLHASRSAVERCAAGQDSGAYLVDVRASVRPGARPSSMHNARIAVNVRSRPRDGGFESCVRRSIRERLRGEAYAVSRAARARLTFRLNERPDRTREPPPPPPYSAAEAQGVLRRNDARLSRCLEVVGTPERLTLRVAIDPNGRMTLMNAQLPAGSPPRALGCLGQVVQSLRVRGAPRRRVQLSHSVGVRGRAY